MKKKLIIIAMLMMCLAVQGYAQGRQEHQRGQRTEQRREYRNGERRSGYSRSGGARGRNRESTAPALNSQRSHDSYRDHSSRRNNYENRRHQSRPTPPPRNYRPSHHYRPTPPPPRYHHHHSYYHHHHHCYFDDWYWFNWGGYRNRFICHRHYPNRFFDSMLGYYLWGALNAPTRLDIGSLSLTRYNNLLKLQVGTQCSYMDLYAPQTAQYQVEQTIVSISTGNGYAIVRFYDEYGNEAVYSL